MTSRISSRMPAIGGPRKFGFAPRLLIAQAMVMVCGAVSAWLVASMIGPGIFHTHLRMAGVGTMPGEEAHVEEAFAAALLISLGVALLAAAALALAVTWYFTRRVQRSISAVADSASEIATGHYSSRVPDPGLGGEFETLASTINELAQRLDAVETTRRRMLADLAHEMRTPLATLDAHLEALEDGIRELDEPTLSVLRSSTQRLGRLAQDINAVSLAQEGALEIQRKLTSPRDLIEVATRSALEGFVAKGVALTTGTSTDRFVSVDAERMGQVLGNLLDNALRHTPAEGNVTIASRDVGKWVEFVVRDSGEGIAAEHLALIFDRFYRVDTARNRSHGDSSQENRTQGGSGIGLAITKALVEAQGGRISATSGGEGQGTTFTVRLPGARRPEARQYAS